MQITTTKVLIQRIFIQIERSNSIQFVCFQHFLSRLHAKQTIRWSRRSPPLPLVPLNPT